MRIGRTWKGKSVCSVTSSTQNAHAGNSLIGKLTVADFVDRTIKWTSELEDHLVRGTQLATMTEYITSSSYRPFVKTYFYYDRVIVHRLYQQPDIFPIAGASENQVICFTNPGSQKPFMALASRNIPDLHLSARPAAPNASPSTATPRPATASTTSPTGRWRSSGSRYTNSRSTQSTRSRSTPSSIMSTPSCTTPRTGRSTSATSSANSRASRSTTTSRSGPRGASS